MTRAYGSSDTTKALNTLNWWKKTIHHPNGESYNVMTKYEGVSQVPALTAEEQRFVDKTVEVIYFTGLAATCIAILWWIIGKITK